MSAVARMIVVLVLLGCSSGCQLLFPGNMKAVQPVSDRPRVGNVYLVRGLIGVFSFGMDGLADKLAAANVRSNVYQDDQSGRLAKELKAKYAAAKQREPLVLIGHSLGADDVLDIAHALDEANIPVDLLVTVDPVNPRAVPKNVRMVLNYYKPHPLDGIPALRGIPLEPEAGSKVALYNLNLKDNRKDLMTSGTNHFNIDKNPRVQEDIVRNVLAVCQPRQVWVRGQQPAQPVPVGGTVAPTGTARAPAGGEGLSAQMASDRSGAPAQASAAPVRKPSAPVRGN